MKRKQEGCDGEETVKRLASPTSIVSDQYLVQPQHLTTVQLLTPATAESLIGASSGVSTVGTLAVPTAVAVAVQTDHGAVDDQCLLGGTITYTQPTPHSSPCNIVLASPQPFVPTSIPVTDQATIASNNSVGVSNTISTGAVPVLATADNRIISYSNSAADNNLLSYNSSTSDNSNTCTAFSTTSINTAISYSTSYISTNSPAPTVSGPLPTVANTYATKRSQESLIERQQRLSERFNALIRAKIVELVRARGIKKTVCPSEVARALSPKAWRDLMPAVRKIGTQLVKEGLILVTQRGTIVDLSTAQGPVRFGLAE
ncbi:uncharacterized protein LOC121855497 [Homarus americanus]|uniref:uncharacterized protein LOC121855497 n=1 Tax=Homarus americanus TaxID=6706 RepID=UPI001C4953D3|nr:uncharacterized protein LOC121855497 [Homarus americanus]